MPLKRLPILIFAVWWTSCAAPAPPADPIIPAHGDVILAANQKSASVTMIEVQSGRTVAHIPVGAGPHEIAVSPDGRTAVAPLFGESFLRGAGDGKQIAVIDVASASVRRIIDLGENTSPHGAVFLADGRIAAVTSSDTETIVLVDTETGSVDQTIPIENSPYLLTAAPNRQFAYSSNPQNDSISLINLASQALSRTIAISGNPGGLAVTPDGKHAWVARTEADALSVIDLETGVIVKTFDGIDIMRRVAISPDGKTVLVTAHAAGEVLVFATETREKIGKISLGEDISPSGATFGATAEIAYVTAPNANLIFELDVKNRAVLRKFAAESSPDGIVFIKRAAQL